jgi:DNA-binding LacI/PurR family transcriptional regulator
VAATIKDIARMAGVSHSTVSRALRGYPAIAPATRSRIKQVAIELGYIPNTMARGLKTSRSHVLGVIVHRVVDPFFGEVLQGIEEVLQAEGYSLFLTASQRNPQRENAIVQAMAERRVDGVIICSSQASDEHLRQLETFKLPVVLLNNEATQTSAYSVYHDDVYGSARLTRHLIELGHTRIGYLGNARARRTTEERLLGFTREMTAADLEVAPELIVEGPNGLPDGGAVGVQPFIALAERPTAIICFNDMVAIGAMQALQRAGICVPEACSVTGFDNIELSAYVVPALTTFDQPKYELGRQAARLMLHLLDRHNGEAPAAESKVLVLRGKLRPRESTAPPGQVG